MLYMNLARLWPIPIPRQRWGTTMTHAYHEARRIIKTTSMPDRRCWSPQEQAWRGREQFQRILGLKYPNRWNLRQSMCTGIALWCWYPTWTPQQPDLFTGNHCDNKLRSSPPTKRIILHGKSERLLEKQRREGNASVTSCSNVTGIKTPPTTTLPNWCTPQRTLFVDFACSAPLSTSMYPEDPEAYLDAILCRPTNFLGGRGSSGILLFNKKLYNNLVPDCPWWGTVDGTTPWGRISISKTLKAAIGESVFQVIRASWPSEGKKMGWPIFWTENTSCCPISSKRWKPPGISIWLMNHGRRLGVISLNIEGLHHAMPKSWTTVFQTRRPVEVVQVPGYL